jgi:hypothetical protein
VTEIERGERASLPMASGAWERGSWQKRARRGPPPGARCNPAQDALPVLRRRCDDLIRQLTGRNEQLASMDARHGLLLQLARCQAEMGAAAASAHSK